VIQHSKQLLQIEKHEKGVKPASEQLLHFEQHEQGVKTANEQLLHIEQHEKRVKTASEQLLHIENYEKEVKAASEQSGKGSQEYSEMLFFSSVLSARKIWVLSASHISRRNRADGNTMNYI
jgi:hypothetical protein